MIKRPIATSRSSIMMHRFSGLLILSMLLSWLQLHYALADSPDVAGAVRDSETTKIPIPSGPQYRYQSTDFVALIHFNMATFAHDGDPGCDKTNWNTKAEYATGKTSDPKTFAPARINTTQWFDSILALGANIAILTAKHGCGYCLWPTNSTFDNGRPYDYHSSRDVIQEFVDSANAAGVGYGFYYSFMKSFKLCRSFTGTNFCLNEVLDNQYNASDEEYSRIATQQVTELWTEYGEMTEIWIDSKDTPEFQKLMIQLQPNAAGTPHHPRWWCGTESGYPSRDVGGGPIWQTGTGFHGNVTSEKWVDKFCDPQLFQDHKWFWQPNLKVRSLADMIPIYHDIVGRGMVMELAFSIDRDGLVDPNHAVVYKQLGDWVRSCYGSAITSISKQQGTILELSIPKGSVFDRVMIQEDISMGQRIRNYTVSVVGTGGAANGDDDLILISNGTSVGRKDIHIFPKIYMATEPATIIVNITQSIATPHIELIGLYEPCYPRKNPKEDNTDEKLRKKQKDYGKESMTPSTVFLTTK